MKYLILLLLCLSLHSGKSQSCIPIPPQPSCPTSYSIPVIAGTDLNISPPVTGNTDYRLPSTTYTGGNIVYSNPPGYSNGTSTLYVCSGDVLNMDYGNITSNINVVVLSGGVLNITGNFDGGNYYVYGTLNNTGAPRYVQGNTNIFVARTAYFSAIDIGFTSSAGKIVNEGYMSLKKVNQINGGSYCNKAGGCSRIDELPGDWQNNVNGLFDDSSGTGTVYVTDVNKPLSSSYLTTSTSTVKVCTAQSPTYAWWGNQSNVSYGCSSAPVNCSPALNAETAEFYYIVAMDKVVLFWNVESSKFQTFKIQKSSNGETWETSGFTKGNSFDCGDSYDSYYRLIGIASNGESVLGVVYVDNKKEQKFSVYPNPSRAGEPIRVDGIGQVTVFDLTGKVVIQKYSNTSSDVTLQKGMYILEFEKNKKINHTKLVFD